MNLAFKPDDWQKYQEATAGGKPRPLLVEAIHYVESKNSALDLGAGALNDTEYLFEIGFKKVVAVDLTPQFKIITPPVDANFQYIESSFEECSLVVNNFDLISAQYALPFTSREIFPTLWEKIRSSLKSGGVFTGQLFGPNDDWVGREGMVFHERSEVLNLIHEFELIKLDEQEFTESDKRGKHWHRFDMIVRRKSPLP